MAILAAQPYNNSNKRPIHQRLGPSPCNSSAAAAGDHRYNKVCNYWRAGRCNRRPCPFLHCELPKPPIATGTAASSSSSSSSSSSTTKRPHQNLTWKRNPSTAGDQVPSTPLAAAHPSTATTQETAKSIAPPVPAKSIAPPVPAKSIAPPVPPNKTMICTSFMSGNCSSGESCKNLHSWFVGDNSFSLLAALHGGHQKAITGITLPSGSDKLVSGSCDGTVRVWDCHTGQCVKVFEMGAEVGCMISEGPWIFIGLTNSIKAWNIQKMTELSLVVHEPIGKVHALAARGEMLFAATEDGHILAWKFGENCFEALASLTGHQGAVVSLVTGEGRLYSGSVDSTIRVWDLSTLQCILTLTGHTSSVMSLLCWKEFLVSGSLDQTIKVWVCTESGAIEVIHSRYEEHGVLGLTGMNDAQAKSVLFCSFNDQSIRLYELPSFRERGKVFAKGGSAHVDVAATDLFFTGDGTGELKVWKWLADKVAAA